MNILEFVLLVWAVVVALAVGIDVGPEIWVEKRDARKAQRARIREAENMLRGAIVKRYQNTAQTVIELKVVALPKKPVGGRHRLAAA